MPKRFKKTSPIVQQSSEGTFFGLPSSLLENLDFGILTNMALAKAIMVTDPYEFSIIVEKMAPLIIDFSDEEEKKEYEDKLKEFEKEILKSGISKRDTKFDVQMAIKKYNYFVTKLRGSIPQLMVGVI